MPPSSAVSRTLPLRRSLKTFDRSPQNILPEYDTTGPGGGGSLHHHHLSSSGSLRHSLLDSSSKYDNHSTYLSRLRSASRDRSDREGSVVSGGASSSSRIVRTLYPTGTSSGEANGWEGGQDAGSTSSSLAASSYSTTSGILASGGGSSISPISTTVSLNSESLLSPTSSFSLEVDSPGSSASRLLSVQEKMNNYSQYYQSLTQNPFRRLPLASPSQIHASSSSSFGVGLSEIRNAQPPPILSRPVAFQPQPAVVPLKVEPPPMEIGPASSTSTSDEGSATPCIQSPVSNPLSSVTSPSISPRQMVSPVTVASPIKSPQEIAPKSLEEIRASKPPSSSSIPRWPTVSVRQHRPLSISSFPDGPRASSVSRVMSPPPPLQQPERNGVTPAEISPSTGIGILKRRDSRATSVERITRLLERKSIPREVNNATTAAATGGDTISQNKTKVGEESTSHIMNGNATASEIEKSSQSSLKKPKFLQSLEKKWEKLTHSGSVTKVVEQHDETVKVAKPSISELKMNGTTEIDVSILSTPASPEPNQAGATSEESSSHEDTKFNESVLLRRALSPEKKVKTNRLASSGGTVGFMLGKFKKLEETPPPASSSIASNTSSRIPTGRPPMAVNGASALTSRLGRRLQMPYAGTTSDSVLTLTAKEMGRTSDISSGDENGLIRSAAAIAQEKRRLQHPRLEVKKDIPTTQEGPSSPPVSQNAQKVFSPPVVPPQIHIQDDPVPGLNDEEMPKMDLSSLSPISVSEGDRTESDESTGTNIKSDSANANDDAESVSDRILRKSFYNRFNASGHKQPNAIDRNRRSHSVTPGSSRRTMPNSGTANLRVNSGGGTSPSTKGSSNGTGHQAPLRRSVSPAASTVASAESKDSSDQSSSQNRSPSPYWSGLNKYNPNPLFKELMVTEDLRSNNDVGKKTEYSRRITSKLSKLLREIESDLNSCQLTKTGSGVSDDGDSTSLLLGAGGSGVGALGGSVVGHLHSNSLIPNRVTSPIPATTSAGTGSLLKRGSKFNANETNGN